MTTFPSPAPLPAPAVTELLIVDFVGLPTDDATKQLRSGTGDTAAAVGRSPT